jgi:hypothetical protein
MGDAVFGRLPDHGVEHSPAAAWRKSARWRTRYITPCSACQWSSREAETGDQARRQPHCSVGAGARVTSARVVTCSKVSAHNRPGLTGQAGTPSGEPG